MSDVLDFITRVLPWGTGLCSLHWKLQNRPGLPGLPFTSPEDLLSQAAYANSRPKLYGDIYMCMASQIKAGKQKGDRVFADRTRDNVAALKSVWVDIDVGKADGYPTVEAALEALRNTCTKAQIPIPSAIVSSGGGLHCYWYSAKVLTLDEWRPYSEGLRAAGMAHGLKADWQCTIDSVRVLRIPNTFNHKFEPPRPVKLLAFNPEPYAFESVFGSIKSTQEHFVAHKRVKSADVADFARFTGQPLVPADGRGVGLELYSDALLAWEPLLELTGCPHVLEAIQTGGASFSQPTWHLDALLTTFLQDGRKIFHRMSNGHKSYSSGDTDAMFDRKVSDKEGGLGWVSCAAIESAGCTSCKTCPHKGQIRSPLNLTRPAAAPFLSKLPAGETPGLGIADAQRNDPGGTAVPFVPNPEKMPRYFKLNDKGWPCKRHDRTDAAGKTITHWEPIWSTKIWGPYLTSKPDALNFHAVVAKNDTRMICVPIEVSNNKDALGTCLTKQFIMIRTGQQEATMEFTKSWVEELKDIEEARQTTPFGWVVQEGGQDIGFVYAGTMYCRDQTTKPAGIDEKLKDTYKVFGKKEVWHQALDLITQQRRPPLEAIVAASLASPLLHITGQNGGAIVGVGIGGANKSSAIDVGNAIWGKPIEAKAAISSSQKGFTKRLSDLHNLPLYWDDVQEGVGLKAAIQALREICQGADGIKLTSDRKYANTGTWQAIMTVCANIDIIDELLKTSKTDAARLYRVFQFDVPRAPDDGPGRIQDSVAKPLLDQLNSNYGHIGALYAKWLGFDPDGVKDVVIKCQNKFTEEIGMKQEERFWVAICACIWSGAYLANEGLGANFHLQELWDFLKSSYLALRERVESEQLEGGGEANTVSYLTGFFKEQGGSTAWAWDMVKTQGRHKALRIIDKPDFVRNPNAHINISWVVDDKLLRISKAAFREYLDRQKTQPSFVFKGLKQHFGMYEIPKVRLHAGIQTGAGGAEAALYIPVKEGTWMWEEMMSKVTPSLKGE